MVAMDEDADDGVAVSLLPHLLHGQHPDVCVLHRALCGEVCSNGPLRCVEDDVVPFHCVRQLAFLHLVDVCQNLVVCLVLAGRLHRNLG